MSLAPKLTPRTAGWIVVIACAAGAGCQAISGLSDLHVEQVGPGGDGGGGAAASTSTAGGGGGATTSTSTSTTASTTTSTTSTSTSSSSTGMGGGCPMPVDTGGCTQDGATMTSCAGTCSNKVCDVNCKGISADPQICGMPAMDLGCGPPSAQHACVFDCETGPNGAPCATRQLNCPDTGTSHECTVVCRGGGSCGGTTIQCGNGPCTVVCHEQGCVGLTIVCKGGDASCDFQLCGDGDASPMSAPGSTCDRMCPPI